LRDNDFHRISQELETGEKCSCQVWPVVSGERWGKPASRSHSKRHSFFFLDWQSKNSS